MLRIDDQRRSAGRIPLVVGRVVEVDITGVGARPRLRALEFTVNVMVFAVVVTVPEADEAVSQLGVVMEYFTLPNVALSA